MSFSEMFCGKSPFKRGLWDNIHAKDKRIKAGSGETKAKKGDSDYPETLDVQTMAFKMKGFKAHDMYLGENNKKWSHEKPSGKHAHVVAKNETAHKVLMNEDSAFAKRECKCWKYHERVPGTKSCAKGSCRKIKRKR